MTVRELIVALLDLDLDMEVYGYDTGTDRSGLVAAVNEAEATAAPSNDVEGKHGVFLEFKDTGDLDVEEADMDGTTPTH